MNIKSMGKRVFMLLPANLKGAIRNWRESKTLRASKNVKRENIIDTETLNTVIGRMQLDRDFIVHAGVSKLGKFSGGVKDVLNSFVAVADKNNVCFITPALPFNTTVYEYLENASEFDVATAPNMMGTVSVLLSRNPQSARTPHPTHSCIVYGDKRREYIDPCPEEYTFGAGSVFRTLCEKNGWIVLFGVDLNSVTCMHVAEDILGTAFPLEVYKPRIFEVKLNRGGEYIRSVKVRGHNPMLSAVRDCEMLRNELVKRNFLRSFPLGAGNAEVLSASGLVLTQLELLLQGKSMYGKVHIDKAQKTEIENAIALTKSWMC